MDATSFIRAANTSDAKTHQQTMAARITLTILFVLFIRATPTFQFLAAAPCISPGSDKH